MSSISELIDSIRKDIPSKKRTFVPLLRQYFYSARFRILLNYRIGAFCHHSQNKLLRQVAKRYKYRLEVKRNCFISYGATIGEELKLPHPTGIVIGDGVVIGNGVTIFQHVTLGSHGKKNMQLRYPTIKEGVKIYAGATIIGNVTVGQKAIVGANSVVNMDVPKGAVAVGVPCRIIKS